MTLCSRNSIAQIFVQSLKRLARCRASRVCAATVSPCSQGHGRRAKLSSEPISDSRLTFPASLGRHLGGSEAAWPCAAQGQAIHILLPQAWVCPSPPSPGSGLSISSSPRFGFIHLLLAQARIYPDVAPSASPDTFWHCCLSFLFKVPSYSTRRHLQKRSAWKCILDCFISISPREQMTGEHEQRQRGMRHSPSCWFKGMASFVTLPAIPTLPTCSHLKERKKEQRALVPDI